MDPITKANLTTLAHANEMATQVILKVAGEEVANTLHGEFVNADQIRDAVAAKMQSALVRKSGVL
jgi:hypothetical protein